jgi:hypothetical protein
MAALIALLFLLVIPVQAGIQLGSASLARHSRESGNPVTLLFYLLG